MRLISLDNHLLCACLDQLGASRVIEDSDEEAECAEVDDDFHSPVKTTSAAGVVFFSMHYLCIQR
jgi:hypothetical protein